MVGPYREYKKEKRKENYISAVVPAAPIVSLAVSGHSRIKTGLAMRHAVSTPLPTHPPTLQPSSLHPCQQALPSPIMLVVWPNSLTSQSPKRFWPRLLTPLWLYNYFSWGDLVESYINSDPVLGIPSLSLFPPSATHTRAKLACESQILSHIGFV